MSSLKSKSCYDKTTSASEYVTENCIFVYTDKRGESFIIFKYKENISEINTYLMRADKRALKPTKISDKIALKLLLDKTNKMVRQGDDAIKKRVIQKILSVQKTDELIKNLGRSSNKKEENSTIGKQGLRGEWLRNAKSAKVPLLLDITE